MLTPFGLVLDQAGQELGIAPLLSDRLLGAYLERVEDAREAQPPQVKGQLRLGLVGGGAHRRPPAAANSPAANSLAWRKNVRLRGGGCSANCTGTSSSPAARMRLSVGYSEVP